VDFFIQNKIVPRFYETRLPASLFELCRKSRRAEANGLSASGVVYPPIFVPHDRIVYFGTFAAIAMDGANARSQKI
jgi:hypothetical protein